MIPAIAEGLKRREEKLRFLDTDLVVKEIRGSARKTLSQEAGSEDFQYSLLIECVFTETGDPVFTKDDVKVLVDANPVVLAPLIQAVMRVCRLNTVEEAKNSGAAQS